MDEIIYTTKLMRDRLILELLARAGVSIGEVLKLTPANIDGIKIVLLQPKSGWEKKLFSVLTMISAILGVTHCVFMEFV